MKLSCKNFSLFLIGLASIPVLAAEPQFVPVNLALNKPTKASSEETGKLNFAKHAVDGKKSTRWCANSSAANEWLQIDLEKPTKINGIDERAKQTISMMPDNLAKDLTLEEFASLLTYLESLVSRATVVSPKAP